MTPFPAALAVFLPALRAMLADATVPPADRERAALAVVTEVSRAMLAAEVGR